MKKVVFTFPPSVVWVVEQVSQRLKEKELLVVTVLPALPGKVGTLKVESESEEALRDARNFVTTHWHRSLFTEQEEPT